MKLSQLWRLLVICESHQETKQRKSMYTEVLKAVQNRFAEITRPKVGYFVLKHFIYTFFLKFLNDGFTRDWKYTRVALGTWYFLFLYYYYFFFAEFSFIFSLCNNLPQPYACFILYFQQLLKLMELSSWENRQMYMNLQNRAFSLTESMTFNELLT